MGLPASLVTFEIGFILLLGSLALWVTDFSGRTPNIVCGVPNLCLALFYSGPAKKLEADSLTLGTLAVWSRIFQGEPQILFVGYQAFVLSSSILAPQRN